MVYFIAATDGRFKLTVEANNLDDALEAMANRFKYPDFRAMCSDLGLSGADLTVATITDERKPAHDLESSADYIQQQRERSVLDGFKDWMRRTA